MRAKELIPLLDVLFLALGAILAQMTEMERVTVLPVELEDRVGTAPVLRTGEFAVLTLDTEGLALDGERLEESAAMARLRGRDVVARVDRRLPTGDALRLLAMLREAGAHVELEVDGR
jgi:biopolymer transport protein ExbD